MFVCCGVDIVTRLCGVVVVDGVNFLGGGELHYEAMRLG